MALYKHAQALAFLAGNAEEPEKSRSSYWTREMSTFSADAEGDVHGATVLGILDRRRSFVRVAAHWVLQGPFRRMGKHFATYGEGERLGRLVAGRQGRQFTGDMQRQVLTVAAIRAQLDGLSPTVLCVIGDGLGVLSSLLLLAFPKAKVISVNLTKALLLDLAAIAKAVPDANLVLATDAEGFAAALADGDVRSIGLQADHAQLLANAPIGVAANIHSMQEMDADVVAEYFRLLRCCPTDRTLFYCCNKLEKRFHDGTITRFNSYPWSAQDHVVVDERSPWDAILYDTRPPFWRRAKSVIWHRLVWLAKEPT